MKMTIRSAVIAALGVVGATAANAANISVPAPSTGNSNLLLFVTDASNHTTYTRVLSQLVTGPTGEFTYAGGGTEGAITTYTGDANFTVNTGADSTLTSFISTANTAGDTLDWGIIAGAYTAPTSTTGNAIAIATTSDGDGSIVTVTNAALSNTMLSNTAGLGKDLSSSKLTGKPQDAFGNATNQGIFGTSSSQSQTNLTFYGAGVDMAGLALGASSTLYAMTAGTVNNVLGFNLGKVTLSLDGTSLTFVGNSAVPLPAAVWLLGSGLVGLAGIGRRRAANATA
jgi:hypothetical protein